MNNDNEVKFLVLGFIIGAIAGFVVRVITISYYEDCHIYRDAPDKEARHCKLRYKKYKEGEK